MDKKKFINEDTLEYLLNVLNNKGSFNSFTILERRTYEQSLTKQIQLYLTRNELEKRNKCVHLLSFMVKDLPFNFTLKEEVLVRGSRMFKAIVTELDYSERQVIVKPIDNQYKEIISVPESWIIPIQNREEESQLKLF